MKNNTMKKNTRTHLENEARMQLDEIFGRIREVKSRISTGPSCYTSMNGEDYHECPGAYNDYMSRAMASDMFHYHLVLGRKYRELAEAAGGWAARMTDFNYGLMRMMDDDAGNRPMAEWDYKKTYEFIAEIKKCMEAVSELRKTAPDDVLGDFMERCKIWAIRVVYMNTWAFSLESMAENEQMLLESRIEMYDNTGNRIAGLDKNLKAFMESLCRIRCDLIRLMTKVAVNSDDYQYVTDTQERFGLIGRAIMKMAD